MDTLVGIAPGILGLVLGLAGAYITLQPVESALQKRVWTAIFVVFTLLAILFTTWDTRLSDRREAGLQRSLDSLQGHYQELDLHYSNLLAQNLTLGSKYDQLVSTIKAKPTDLDVANQRTLKHQIMGHLKGMSARFNRVYQETVNNPQDTRSYQAKISDACGQQASLYSGQYEEVTRQLLQRAVQLGVLASDQGSISGRYLSCQDFYSEVNQLRGLLQTLPD